MTTPVDEILDSLSPNGWLKHYVRWARKRMDLPDVYHLASGLIGLAQTIPSNLAIPHGTPIQGNIYTLLVGESATGKTQAITLFQKLAQKTTAFPPPQKPGSAEFLTESLLLNPKQLMFYPEFGNFLANTKESYQEAIKTTYTEVYDCVPISRGTMKKGGPVKNGTRTNNANGNNPTLVVEPRLCLLGASTPYYLETYTSPVDWSGGFMSRFLCFSAEPYITSRLNSSDPDGENKLAAALGGLASWSLYGDCNPIDGDAAACLQEIKRDITNSEKLIADPSCRGTIKRSELFVFKLALALAWDDGTARKGGNFSLTCEHFQIAKMIVDLHIQSVVKIIANLASTKDQQDRRSVLNAIEKSSPTPLSKIISYSRLLKRRVVEVIDSLIAERMIESAGFANGQQCYQHRASDENFNGALPVAEESEFIKKPDSSDDDETMH